MPMTGARAMSANTRASKLAGQLAVVVGLLSAGFAGAQDSREDIVAGEKLYIAQCKLCHGSAGPETVRRGPLQPRRPGLQLAALQSGGMSDAPAWVFPPEACRADSG